MEQKNFIERMHKILKKVNKEYTVIPTIMQQTFDNLISKRVSQELIECGNPGVPTLFIDKDIEENLYLTYINEDGVNLNILDGRIEYKGLEKGIDVKISTFLHEFGRVIKEEQIKKTELMREKLDEIFEKVKSGEVDFEEYGRATEQLGHELGTLKTPEEYLEKVLNNYMEELGEQSFYSMRCNIAEGEGSSKGPRINKSPIRIKKEEFNLEHRIEGIEKLMPIYELLEINDGEYYGYIYDLEQNRNGEKGYMIIVEPREYESKATRVIYLPEEKFKKIKDDNKDKQPSDIEAKAMLLKEVLENKEKLSEASKILHKDFGKWLAIMDYYLKGSKQIDPEILEIINDDKFKERFPREYLSDLRNKLLNEGEER